MFVDDLNRVDIDLLMDFIVDKYIDRHEMAVCLDVNHKEFYCVYDPDIDNTYDRHVITTFDTGLNETEIRDLTDDADIRQEILDNIEDAIC